MKTKLLLLMFIFTGFSLYAQFWTTKDANFTTEARGISQFSIANNAVWATAYDGSGTGANVQEITKSTDAGETWMAMDINLGPGTSGLGISNIFALDTNTAWIVAYSSTIFDVGGVWKTEDGGTTWSKQTSASYNSTGSFPNVVYFWDANTGFCQGDPVNGFFELYTTTDGGDNWNRVPSSNIPTPLPGENGYVRQIEVVGNRIWWTTNKGRIFRSDDYGLTWDVFQSPITDFGSSTSSGEISFWNDNDGLLASAQGQLFKTTDGGEVWNVLSPVDSGAFDIECIEGTNKAVFTGHNGGTPAVFSTYYSLDGGLTWTLVDNTQRIELEFSSSIGFAGGFTQGSNPTTGGIFKYTGTELSLSIDSNQLSITNAYPNPVKDIFTIEGVDIISDVSVFNVLGQEVLNTQPNVSVAKIDMSNLTSGSYVVKVTVNGNTQTIKLIK